MLYNEERNYTFYSYNSTNSIYVKSDLNDPVI